MKAAIVGIAGPTLLDEETRLFRAHPPAGVILFARNVVDPHQLAMLMTDLRRVLPRGAARMVDQEGGRVARLRPPHWRGHPPAATIGRLFTATPGTAARAAWLNGALIGIDCAAAGFTVVAAPVLDLSVPGAHDVIGDRAFSTDPTAVARLGRAMASGLLAAGIQPVGKHAPGHGRARVDSHLTLPRVEEIDLDADLMPFALNAGLPWMMTAHIVYPAFDTISAGTVSQAVVDGVIRRRIGFEGVLVTDDLAMKALSGRPDELAAQALAAGCDVTLYCSGELASTAALLESCPPLTDAAIRRLASARHMATRSRRALDAAALADERDRLLA